MCSMSSRHAQGLVKHLGFHEACRRVEDCPLLLQARDVDLSSLKKLERLRLVNIMASKLNVRRECSISIVRRGLASLNLGICKDKELRVLSANFSVPQNM